MSYLEVINGRQVSLSGGHMPRFDYGLDAQIPANPGLGDTYYSTDTLKTYKCFISDQWMLWDSPVKEEYINHEGTSDNIMKLISSGNGSALTNVALHRADLSSGTLLAGYGLYRSNTTWQLSSIPLIATFQVTNNVQGAGGSGRDTLIGFTESFETYDINTTAGAIIDMYYNSSAAMFLTSTGINDQWYGTMGVAISNGDFITIIATTSRIIYMQNGIVKANHAQYVPTGKNLYFGIMAKGDVNATTARQVSADMVSLRRLS